MDITFDEIEYIKKLNNYSDDYIFCGFILYISDIKKYIEQPKSNFLIFQDTKYSDIPNYSFLYYDYDHALADAKIINNEVHVAMLFRNNTELQTYLFQPNILKNRHLTLV